MLLVLAMVLPVLTVRTVRVGATPNWTSDPAAASDWSSDASSALHSQSLDDSSALHSHVSETAAVNDETLEKYVVRIRRELHRIPETCYAEDLTAAVIIRELTLLGGVDLNPGGGGIHIIATGVGGTGVVARVGSGAAPVIILRADIDGLPVPEETPSNVPPSLVVEQSTHEGRSHACGHDGHAAMLLGAAKLLTSAGNEDPGYLSGGTVLLVFQPAEEGEGGMARMMAEGGLLTDKATFGPTPSSAFALHIWPYSYAPTGSVLGKSGPIMVASSAFRFVVKGQGGHAAIPDQNVDPVVTLCHVVSALQSIVSRETSPRASAVVSVTTLGRVREKPSIVSLAPSAAPAADWPQTSAVQSDVNRGNRRPIKNHHRC